jgi:hypothetical protein
MACDPVTLTAAGFWPGGWVAPAGFVHVAVGLAVALSVTSTSPFPRPDSSPEAVSVRPVVDEAWLGVLPALQVDAARQRREGNERD